MSQNFTVVIPARYASSRLPGKMLATIADKPMIQHVYERACSSAAKRVLIATDHIEIETAAKRFGAEVIQTSPDHQSGTDRLQEVCSSLKFDSKDIVVNIQGDEPLIPPPVINQVADLLAGDAQASVATLCEAIRELDTFLDPNAVKVVCDDYGQALYFSRAPVPWPRDEFSKEKKYLLQNEQAPLRHLGIYAYRVSLLNRFVTWPMAQLEKIEKLEQLRVLANGEKIAIAQACEDVPGGVDTEQDLNRIRELFAAK